MANKGNTYGIGSRVALPTHNDNAGVIPTPSPEGEPGRSIVSATGLPTPQKKGRALLVSLQSGGLTPSQLLAAAKKGGAK